MTFLSKFKDISPVLYKLLAKYKFIYMTNRLLARLKNKIKKKNARKHEPRHEISDHVVGATSKDSDQPAHMRSLIRAFANRLNILKRLGPELQCLLRVKEDLS